jgi:hypothetical protein
MKRKQERSSDGGTYVELHPVAVPEELIGDVSGGLNPQPLPPSHDPELLD